MASIREWTHADGTKTWGVLYRQGGKQTSITFSDRASARKYRVLVDQFGPEHAADYLREYATKEPVGPTVGELATQWLEWKATGARKVTKRVHDDYARDVRLWIVPMFGHRLADRVTVGDIQAWVDSMSSTGRTGKPLSPKAVYDKHAVLYAIYKWASAKSRGLVEGNPCTETELPTRTRKPPKGFTQPELSRLLSVGSSIDQDAADVVAYLGGTGCRVSEAIAVIRAQVEDLGFDFEGRDLGVYVTITRSWRRKTGFIEGTKSEAGGRRIRVLGDAVAVVRRRIERLGDHDLVFTRDGHPWAETTFRDRRWPKIVRAADLEHRAPTIHWLRHTHVFMCARAGMGLAEISRRLGHEDIRTTINVYGRMIEDMTDEVAARLDQLLTGSQSHHDQPRRAA